MTAGGRSPRQPIAWLLWHPHQKLWNWRLVGVITRLSARPAIAERAVRLLVLVDSLLLLATATLRRITATAAGALAPPQRDAIVLHIDCGVHKDGHEIVWMHRWFAPRYNLKMIAFEAGREQFEQAASNLESIPDLDLRRAAVVGPGQDGPTVELHLGHADGRGASLFPVRGGAVEEVPAVRLSEILETMSPQPDAVILRMNIEGAEKFAIQDLVASGLQGRVNGYYGMWDDLSKIDPRMDGEFRGLLKRHGIRTMAFNERDLAHPIRRFAIRTDIDTAIRRALARGPAGGNRGQLRTGARAVDHGTATPKSPARSSASG